MSDEYSRPATLEDLKSLIRSLNENRVDYLLIGGYALYAHALPYAETIDLDGVPVRTVNLEGLLLTKRTAS